MPASTFGWFATMPTGLPSMQAKPTSAGGAEQFLHLHEFAVIDDATNHFEHVVGLTFVGGHDGGKSLGDSRVRRG